jgi:hypothetical protein
LTQVAEELADDRNRAAAVGNFDLGLGTHDELTSQDDAGRRWIEERAQRLYLARFWQRGLENGSAGFCKSKKRS